MNPSRQRLLGNMGVHDLAVGIMKDALDVDVDGAEGAARGVRRSLTYARARADVHAFLPTSRHGAFMRIPARANVHSPYAARPLRHVSIPRVARACFGAHAPPRSRRYAFPRYLAYPRARRYLLAHCARFLRYYVCGMEAHQVDVSQHIDMLLAHVGAGLLDGALLTELYRDNVGLCRELSRRHLAGYVRSVVGRGALDEGMLTPLITALTVRGVMLPANQVAVLQALERNSGRLLSRSVLLVRPRARAHLRVHSLMRAHVGVHSRGRSYAHPNARALAVRRA